MRTTGTASAMQSYLNGFREIDLSFGRILHSLLRADETLLTLAFTSRPGRRGRGGEVLPFTSYIASVALKDGLFFFIPLVQQRV